MVYKYSGHYTYDEDTISNWDSSAIGVYYCGVKLADGNLRPHYIGSGTSENGMRGRLLAHINEEKWPDVTHFGYHTCSTVAEAKDWEAQEIARYQPKYNKVGK